MRARRGSAFDAAPGVLCHGWTSLPVIVESDCEYLNPLQCGDVADARSFTDVAFPKTLNGSVYSIELWCVPNVGSDQRV
jgi:hypothetical protein